MAELDLIDAIKGKAQLRSVGDCSGVPARIGLALYGAWQDDEPALAVTAQNAAAALWCTLSPRCIGIIAGATPALSSWSRRTATPLPATRA
jgi:hypothetical protein